MSASLEPYEEARPGALVDHRYLLKREIARGAMGVVFEAQHRILGTTVALKTLTTQSIDWVGGRERLMREARVLALCRHPRIVAPIDAGICSSHGPFLALEMLDGRSLDSMLITRRRLTVEQVVEIGLQLCEAVHWAHRHGVIHRDIKPANVVVLHDEATARDQLRLIDFGIATVPTDKDVVGRKLTGRGEWVGTVEYMAPQQLVDRLPADVHSDVYALGVLLYECLFGDVPYPGNATAVTASHLARVEPQPFTKHRADVPVALASLVLSAMDRDLAKRPSTAAALGAALGKLGLGAKEGLQLSPAVEPKASHAPRQYPRVPYAAPVRLVGRDTKSDGRTEDISEGGMLLLADLAIERGEQVQVKMPLPASGRIATIEAVVRWCTGVRGRHAIGLSFGELPADVRADVQQYAQFMVRDREQPRDSAELLGAR